MHSTTFIIAGGGTGGHLFPGIAVCRELKSRFPRCRILFAVGHRRMESDILNRHGFEVRHISVEGIKGKGWTKKMKAFSCLPVSFFQARRLLAETSPACVIGMGGYSSGPVCVAARVSGVASLIHEQNSFPGLTNRLLCRLVDRVCISFEDSASRFPGGKIVVTGNPVRDEFFTIGEKVPFPADRFTLLVVGGSLGSRPVNDAVVDSLAALKKRGILPAVIHQTGEADYERIAERYNEQGLDGELHRFIDDMADAYRRADLVVGRAGATTIFELAAAGRPAILIPYPFAADQHQKANAESLASAGGARIILQQDLDGTSLALAIEELIGDADNLARMGTAARTTARPGAASVIVDEIEAVAGERGIIL
ncbi:MAG: undecaprenyldiphospho-muramoylpentapeptide beta-N-acetylglucosaminyltransferase [Desulfatiglandaceae bacterium]